MDFKKLVKNAGEQVKNCAAFSAGEIKHICETFGPRPCGEESEKKAQEYLVQLLGNFADSVTRETYEVHPEAFMAFVPLAGACLLGTTAANFARIFTGKKGFTAASYGLIGTAIAGLVGEFALYKKPLDPLFKKKESGNVIAVRKAQGETKRRAIISGHTDSAPEWTYTYRLGSKGVLTVCGYAVAGLVYDLIASGLMAKAGAGAAKKMALAQLAFLPANIALFFFTNNKRYVDGASDDLSGSMVASSVFKFLSDNDIRFENTEVIALLTGGEEAGLRGAKAFFEAHPEIGKDGVETAFFGFDTVRDEDFMNIYEKDMSGLVKNDAKACRLVQEACKKCGFDVPLGSIPLGSTDAAAASQAGVPAAAFCAMDPAPARYYHTRLDTADNIKEDTIEKGINIALETVFSFDEGGLG